MDIVSALFLTLGALTSLYVVRWGTALYRSRSLAPDALQRASAPGLILIVIGFVTNFFDTLGIGSFATTMSTYRLLGLVPDERIPGTLLVGHTLPVVVQAFAFISMVSVDRTLLVSIIVAMMAGGGSARVSCRGCRAASSRLAWPRALLLAGFFMTVGLLGLYPTGGQAVALGPAPFVIAWIANFVFGAISTLGIGNYGPCLVLFSLLGMDPRAAFPIMMGSAAFTGLLAAMRFVGTGRYVAPAAIGLTLGGIPGVLIAVWLVKSLPLDVVRWGVIAIVLYTAVTLIRSASEDRRVLAAARADSPA